MLPLGEPFAAVVFGEPWRDAGYAAMAMFAYVGGRSITSLAGEAFKAAARPDLLPRLSLLTAVLNIGFIVALLPLGLVGVAAAISVSSIGVASYALRSAARVLGTPVSRLLREIWPALTASLFMAGVLLPVEHLVVDAAGRETALGVSLLVAELAAAAVLYLVALAVVAPPVARELLGLVRQVPRRLARRAAVPEATTEHELPASPKPVT
jgi:O-antigen/teichoic acid export membrane protein